MTDEAAGPSDVPPTPEPLYEPGRRWRWVAPVLLALAGWCVIQNIMFRLLMIPDADARGDAASSAALGTAANVGAACGVVLAVAGIAAGTRGMRRIEPVFHGTWTIVLFALAAIALLPVPVFAFVASQSRARGETEAIPLFNYLMALSGAGAAVLALLGALRWRRVRLAAVFTPALALTLLIVFPVGTLLSAAWFLAVRKRETSAL